MKSKIIPFCFVSLWTCATPHPEIIIRPKEVITGVYPAVLPTIESAIQNIDTFAKNYSEIDLRDIKSLLYLRLHRTETEAVPDAYYFHEGMKSVSKRLQFLIVQEWLGRQLPLGTSYDEWLTTTRQELQEKAGVSWPFNENAERRLARLSKIEMAHSSSTPLRTLDDINRRIDQTCQGSYDVQTPDLNPIFGDYWSLSLELCKGTSAKAIEGFTTMSKQKSPLAYAAIQKLIQFSKSQGARAEVAKLYIDLTELKFTAKQLSVMLGQREEEVQWRLIDDLLWASRNQALLGSYDKATQLAERALKLSESVKDLPRQRLLRIEILHTLATRISIEKGDTNLAIQQLEQALELAQNDKEWRERILWLVGMYHFISENKPAALDVWNDLLRQTNDSSQRAKLLFWTARIMDREDQTSLKNERLKELSVRYRLSFYNIVATTLTGLTSEWTNGFENLASSHENLLDIDRFDIDHLPRPLQTALLRAEIAIAAGVPRDLQDILLRDFEDLWNASRLAMTQEQRTDLLIYLSRLQMSAGMHAQSFRITSQLDDTALYTRWPDQLLVLFPRPHYAVPKEPIDELTVLSIARQESSFDPKAVSPVGAVGILQLMIATAQRFAQVLNLSTPINEENLKDPSLNIQLGAHYLRFLSERYPEREEAVYAAYNAGEFATDAWIARRAHPDRLVWIENIPFGETQNYVKNVWRNRVVYEALQRFRLTLVGLRPLRKKSLRMSEAVIK